MRNRHLCHLTRLSTIVPKFNTPRIMEALTNAPKNVSMALRDKARQLGLMTPQG